MSAAARRCLSFARQLNRAIDDMPHLSPAQCDRLRRLTAIELRAARPSYHWDNRSLLASVLHRFVRHNHNTTVAVVLDKPPRRKLQAA